MITDDTVLTRNVRVCFKRTGLQGRDQVPKREERNTDSKVSANEAI